MVDAYQRARRNPYLAAEADLALRGIAEPTQQQRVAALIDAEFKLRVIAYLSRGK